MVITNVDQPRCRDCREIMGDASGSYVYCSWLNCRVWGASMQCEHAKEINEAF